MLSVNVAAEYRRSKSLRAKKEVQDDQLDSSPESLNSVKMDMDQVKEVENNKNPTPKMEVHNSLKQEIIQLEKRLQDQFKLHSALEKALGHGISPCNKADKILMPKSAMELIKEIATLELEVVHLEQYLLSLYRKAFDGQSSSVSPSAKDEKLKSPSTPRGRLLEVPQPDIASKDEDSAVPSGCQSLENPRKDSSDIGGDKKLLASNFHRSESSLTGHVALLNRVSPSVESLDRTLRACNSQPVSMMEYAQNVSSNVISLAEHLGTRISDHVPENPNRLSEDMVKCISAIYCKVAEPPMTNHGLSSPMSSLSSVGAFSPREQSVMCSPGFRNNSSFDLRLDNPFLVEGLKDFSGPYSTMVEVSWICGDRKKLKRDVESLLDNFRLLISRLEEVDLRKLKYEEKLAFWINVHNSLVMHTYLAYGVPQNNVKRAFLLLKSAYNVGGHTISVHTIQSCILGCRMPRPGQWLRLLLSSRTKFKTGDERQAYMIDHPEPLLRFALCSGNHSDPAVRVYTAKRVFQELESAKEDYIRATFGVFKDRKILLPKIIESFAKDSGLCSSGLIEMILKSLPESLRKSIRRSQLGNFRKCIEWIPLNYTFRYLISKELVN